MKLIKDFIIIVLILLTLAIICITGIPLIGAKWYQIAAWFPMAYGFAYFSIYAILKFDRWYYKQLK